MASLTAVVEERGQDWDVRHDYQIQGVSQDFPGQVIEARDSRMSGLPVLLRAIPLAGAHAQELLSGFATLRDASLKTPYIGIVYRLVLHRRAEGTQLIVASEMPQQGTLDGLLKKWAQGAQNAPPALDDAQVLHAGLSMLEGLREFDEAGFSYRSVHPGAIGIGNARNWDFLIPKFMDFPVPGSGSQRPPAFIPAATRGRDEASLSQDEHVAMDLYGLGVTLYNLRTWALWPGAEASEGLSDAAQLELNKFRVGDPLRDVLTGLMGQGSNAPEITTYDDARDALESSFWKVSAAKGGVGLPSSPLQSQVSTNLGQESLVILEDRELWNRAPENTQDAVIKEVGRELGEDYKWLRTDRFDCNGQSFRIAVFEHLRTGMEMCLVPGGLYDRGCGDAAAEIKWLEKQGFENPREYVQHETPSKTVVIQPMLVGRFPVLCPEWDKMAKGAKVKNTATSPVVEVPYDEVISRLEALPGGLRLPSEAEWEYACRAGTTTRFFWGNEMDASYCWHITNCDGDPQDVMKHKDKANAFGLVDMLGNVLEWCEDHYLDRYLEAPTDHRPYAAKDPGEEPERVVRGGCAWYNAAYCRSTARAAVRSPVRKKKTDPSPPAFSALGFRVVRSFVS